MARYIDADELIAHLKDEIKACEPVFGGRANGKSVAYGTELGLKSAISYAETLSTADVVPKSEVVNILDELMKEAREISTRYEKSANETSVYDYARIEYRGCQMGALLVLFKIEDQIVRARESAIFDTGVHIELPVGTVGMLKSKSGLNVKYGITSEGVIDVGYTGSIVVKLYNHSGFDYRVKAGDKISQLVIHPILTPTPYLVSSLEETERGDNGFSSSGR